jgi:hypothetical protein
MISCICYHAISVESDLYRLLREDPVAELLYLGVAFQLHLIDEGEISPEYLAKIFDSVIEELGLDHREQVDRSFARLEEAVARASETDPWFPFGWVWIPNDYDKVRARLTKIFTLAGIEDPEKLSGQLIFGESRINPERLLTQEFIRVISPDTLKQCSEAMSLIDMETLDPIESYFLRQHYKHFIDYCKKSATRGDVIMVRSY